MFLMCSAAVSVVWLHCSGLVVVFFTLVHGGKELRLLWGQGQGHQCVDVNCLRVHVGPEPSHCPY